jgi:hypothetical protein
MAIDGEGKTSGRLFGMIAGIEGNPLVDATRCGIPVVPSKRNSDARRGRPGRQPGGGTSEDVRPTRGD